MKVLYNKIDSIFEKEGTTSTVTQNISRHGYLTTTVSRKYKYFNVGGVESGFIKEFKWDAEARPSLRVCIPS